jgi:hypothetical protein
MKTADGSFHYAYNAQAVVDEKSQVVLAGVVTQQVTDVNQLTPMIEAMGNQLVRAGVEDRPKVLLADAGYCSKDNLETLAEDDLDACHGPADPRRASHGRTERAYPVERDSQATYGATPSDQGRMSRLRPTKGDRQTGIRLDEGPTARRSSPLART